MSQFTKAFKGLDSAIQQGTARALNRALSSTQTKLAKDIKADIGLPTNKIKTRMLVVKATSKKLNAVLAIAVKVGVALSEFAPSVKKVRVLHQGNKKPTLHYGVSVKIGSNRSLVPGGWLALAKNGKRLVLGRKGILRYPTVVLRTQAFKEAVENRKAETTKDMQTKFASIVSQEIENSVQFKFNSDKT